MSKVNSVILFSMICQSGFAKNELAGVYPIHLIKGVGDAVAAANLSWHFCASYINDRTWIGECVYENVKPYYDFKAGVVRIRACEAIRVNCKKN